MPNIKLVLEYNGSFFSGSAPQKDTPTVYSELKNALNIFLGEDNCLSDLQFAGRTDAGVHALGQVVNFHCDQLPDLSKLSLGISSLLRNKLSVLEAEEVKDDFHARFSAKGKVYIYKILNRHPAPVLDHNLVWHVPGRLNLTIMQEQTKLLVGKHDFQAFRAADCGAKETEKEIFSVEWSINNDNLEFKIHGNGFLKQMVRTIIGTLVEFGQGKIKPKDKDMSALINSKDRNLAGQTAPAHGLYLKQVIY